MSSLDSLRQQFNLDFVAGGEEYSFGDAAACPLSPEQLACIDVATTGVEALISSGLTAEVYRLKVDGRRYAVKKARLECLVKNADGRTSFLNELQRHAELRNLDIPGVLKPLYGSLRLGIIISTWIDGVSPQRFEARQLHQLFETGCALVANGFFEWDFSPGNLLDDGERLWLFDFGYMYRFDPLRQFNSAGNGEDCPQFHLAERIMGRNFSAQLLDIELALDESTARQTCADFILAALRAYECLHHDLARRGAQQHVLSWLAGLIAEWRTSLEGALAALYLKVCWRAHASDLDDDLRGKSCTSRTLQRADWLIQKAGQEYVALQSSGALLDESERLSSAALVAHYLGLAQQARRHLLA